MSRLFYNIPLIKIMPPPHPTTLQGSKSYGNNKASPSEWSGGKSWRTTFSFQKALHSPGFQRARSSSARTRTAWPGFSIHINNPQVPASPPKFPGAQGRVCRRFPAMPGPLERRHQGSPFPSTAPQPRYTPLRPARRWRPLPRQRVCFPAHP